MTTIDPDTAEVGNEPLRALGKFRCACLRTAAPRKVAVVHRRLCLVCTPPHVPQLREQAMPKRMHVCARRSGKLLGWADERRSWTHAVFFGWNACVTQAGRVAVGDAVVVQAH